MSALAVVYVVVGGGLTGCVVASRLKQNDPSITLIVLEAGPKPESKHDVMDPWAALHFKFQSLISSIRRSLTTTPRVAFIPLRPVKHLVAARSWAAVMQQIMILGQGLPASSNGITKVFCHTSNLVSVSMRA